MILWLAFRFLIQTRWCSRGISLCFSIRFTIICGSKISWSLPFFLTYQFRICFRRFCTKKSEILILFTSVSRISSILKFLSLLEGGPMSTLTLHFYGKKNPNFVYPFFDFRKFWALFNYFCNFENLGCERRRRGMVAVLSFYLRWLGSGIIYGLKDTQSIIHTKFQTSNSIIQDFKNSSCCYEFRIFNFFSKFKNLRI